MLLILLVVISCQSATTTVEKVNLKEALTFYASFDEGFAADFADGDPTLYTAPSWDPTVDAAPIVADNALVSRLPAGGRAGGALRFSTNWNPVVYYAGKDNVAYTTENWSGAFSFWLRIDPDEGLEAGYSDPFIITDKNWDNASLYVDFTDTVPRNFRFAAFADHGIWNPELLAWDDVPPAARPMLDLENHPFSADSWTHVVLSFEGMNGEAARMTGYLNGQQVGVFDQVNWTLSWEIEKVMMSIGRHYTGDLDELAVFNRALTAREVEALFAKPLLDLL
ncbi:MAG: LamG-like jellyroll fold domain-containing protein [Bacteroidota bacterium]